MMGSDEAAIALDAIIDANATEGDRNEAQTRFDLIDRLLEESLEWEHAAIRVERSVTPGFTDYELGSPGTLMIVEAKREGSAFVLPTGLKSGVHSIAPIIRDSNNVPLREAMNQVMRYCSTRGVAPAVVTNGHQWVAFLASRTDGIAPLEGKALFFCDLSAIREEFVTFWNHLSPAGIASRRLFATLSVSSVAPPRPLSASLHGYPGTKRRNSIQSNLQIMGQLMLEDVPTSEEYSDVFLGECYAASGALSSYAEISKDILQSRSSLLTSATGIESEPVETRKGINPQLSKDALAAAMTHRPIILMGSVGVGKSTFIQHLIHIDAKNVFQDAISLVIDFGYEANLEDPAAYTLSEIKRKLRIEYQIDIEAKTFVEDLYRREIQRFDEGINGELKEADPPQYRLRRIDHLNALLQNHASHVKLAIDRITRTRRRQVVIFLDNVDQRSKDDQNNIFLVSNELAAQWSATVFVSLRPETFYESERYGAVSGYHPRVFTISPPRTDVMLKKRVDFAIKILNSKESLDGTRGASGVAFESDNLLHFLEMLSENFSRNPPFMGMVDNLAGGNMRRALDFITEFIGSGHVDTQKIILLHQQSGYTIPMHEFLRSLLHGDGEYYDPQHSPIPNLFQIDQPDSRGHFLLLIALDFISRKGEAREQAGFVGLDSITNYLQGLGYSVESILFALEYSSRFRLIESPLSDASIASAEKCRVTSVGAYAVRRLPQLFTYLDAIVVDTPILDAVIAGDIRDEHHLPGRILRAKRFHDYLDRAWSSAGITPEAWDWAPISAQLKSDIDLVDRRSTNMQRGRVV